MYFLNRSSVFIKNCIFMTAQTWWFQASTQKGPGPRWWPCIQLRGSFGCYMTTNGNFLQNTETLMYFLNRSSVFIKNCSIMTHRPGGIRPQIKTTLVSGAGSVFNSEGSLKAQWQKSALLAVERKPALMYFLNRSSVFTKNCSIMTAQTLWYQAPNQSDPGLTRCWL